MLLAVNGLFFGVFRLKMYLVKTILVPYRYPIIIPEQNWHLENGASHAYYNGVQTIFLTGFISFRKLILGIVLKEQKAAKMSENSSKDTVLKTAMTYICGGKKWRLQITVCIGQPHVMGQQKQWVCLAISCNWICSRVLFIASLIWSPFVSRMSSWEWNASKRSHSLSWVRLSYYVQETYKKM